jgi:Trk K+ transport system NAD-binding subunit
MYHHAGIKSPSGPTRRIRRVLSGRIDRLRRKWIKSRAPGFADMIIFVDSQRRGRSILCQAAKCELEVSRRLARWGSAEDDADIRDVLSAAADIRTFAGETLRTYSNSTSIPVAIQIWMLKLLPFLSRSI